MTRSGQLALLGWVFVVVGLITLGAERFQWLGRMQRHRILRWLARPYGVLDWPWLAGGRSRFMRIVGWGLLVLGGFVLWALR